MQVLGEPSHQKPSNYARIKCISVLHKIIEYELNWFQHLKRTYNSKFV